MPAVEQVLRLTAVTVEDSVVDVHLRPPPEPPPAVQCVVTARIGGDQLTVQGLAFDQPRNVFAITGGTGRWRNAGGQVVIRSVSDTENRLTLFIHDLG